MTRNDENRHSRLDERRTGALPHRQFLGAIEIAFFVTWSWDLHLGSHIHIQWRAICVPARSN